MNRIEEIELISKLLNHPCGYDIDIQGMLWVRRYEHPMWAVEWEIDPGTNNSKIKVKEFNNTKDAATFFVNKRYELKLGLDNELV